MSTKTGQSTRHAPLGQVIQDDANRDRYASRKKLPARDHRGKDDGDDEEELLLDAKTSKRILELSREQMKEVEEEHVKNAMRSQRKQQTTMKPALKGDDSSDEEESASDEEEYEDDDLIQHDEGYVAMSNTGLTPEEEALLSNMMSGNGGGEEEPQRKTLADIIMEKIEEKEAMANMPEDGEYDGGGVDLPVKVIQVRLNILICK